MIGRNAVFVDPSTLNVLFKLDTKFVAALNYGSAINRLGEAICSLGAGYDVYLCLKPRAEGEGDIVLDELSMSGFPFVADSTELYRVLTFFRESNGVGDVYLCNWLHNFIATARVPSFKSVFYYGDRVAYIEVKERLLERFELYDNQLKFAESVGDQYNVYGDLGLTDVDGLKAQYPELIDGSKAQLTAIAPLVQTYRSPLKMKTDDLYEKLKAKFQRNEEAPIDNTVLNQEKPSAVSVKPNIKSERPVTQSELTNSGPVVKEYEKKNIVRRRTPFLAKILVVLCALLSFSVGVSANIALKSQDIVDDSYFSELDSKLSTMSTMSSVYTNSIENMSKFTELYEYITASELEVTVLGFEFTVGANTVRCACASKDIATEYEEYIAKEYVVESTNDLGITGTQDQQVYQFSIMFS